MGANTWINYTLFDVWKLIGATLLFFLMLVLGVEQVGESYSVIRKDYFGQEWVEWEHLSPSGGEEILEELCKNSLNLCDKVVYSGTLSQLEKVKYTSQYLDIITFLDMALTQGDRISQALKLFIINAEKGRRRGGATAKRITINLASMGEESEYWWVLTHEFWHILDLGALKGLSQYKHPAFTEFGKVKFSLDDPSLEYYRYSRESETTRTATSEKSDFCSGYGMTNPFEDFAECHNLYLNNSQLFKKMASESWIMKNKYNYFANLFAAQVLQQGNQELLYPYWRPWDTTVI